MNFVMERVENMKKILLFAIALASASMAEMVHFTTAEGYVAGALKTHANWAYGDTGFTVNPAGTGTITLDGTLASKKAVYSKPFYPTNTYVAGIQFSFNRTAGATLAAAKDVIAVEFTDVAGVSGTRITMRLQRQLADSATYKLAFMDNSGTTKYATGTLFNESLLGFGASDSSSDKLWLGITLYRGADANSWTATGVISNLTTSTLVSTLNVSAFDTTSTYYTDSIYAVINGSNFEAESFTANRVVDAFVENRIVLPPMTYHVSPTGNDLTGNGSLSTPYQTIAKASSRMRDGDTCIIHAGTYRESINPLQSGTADRPITYKNAGDGAVTLNGTTEITGWTKHQQINGKWIWKATMPAGLNRGILRNQILADGFMMPEARWPNLSNWVDGEGFDLLDSSQLAVAAVPYNPNDVAQIQVPDATQPDNFWAGAYVWADVGARWQPDMAKIVASTSGSLTISNKSPVWFPQNDLPGPQGNAGGLYISGTIAALDAPGEWYYDAANQLLYLIPQDGTDPNTHLVEARTDALENLINLTQNWIVVDGVNCFAGAGQITGSNCTVKNCSFNYISHELTSNVPTDPAIPTPPSRGGVVNYNRQIGGLYISGSDNVVVQCRFNTSSSNGINLSGIRNTVSNCFIQNMNYNGDYSSGVSMNGNQCTVAYCTLTRAGRTLIEPRGTQDMIHHNDLSWGMLYSNDGGAIYTIGTTANGTEISYNRIHDIRTWSLDPTIRSYLQAGLMPGAQLNTSVHCGIYLDAVCAGYILHHNLIWNCTEGINIHAAFNQGGKPHGEHHIFNNTEWNLIETGSGIKDPDSVMDIRYWNNLSQYYNFNGATVVSNYPAVYGTSSAPNPGFVSVPNLDFRLKSTCALINAGTTNLVPYAGYVYTYNGSAPDLGAFEYGEEPWVAGAIVADFTATTKVGIAPLVVSFTDASIGSSISSLLWDFGDGQTATSAAGATVSHTYAANGTYTVSLTASGEAGTSSETKWDYITLANVPPVAQFTATPTSGVSPLTVTFTDASSGGVVSLRWLFGDGQSTNTAAGAVVTHTYTVGTYIASLIAMGPFGTNTLTKTISVEPDLNASITFDFDNPAASASKTYTFSKLTGKPTVSAGTASGAVTDAANMGTETFSMTITSVANWSNAAAQADPAGASAYLASLTTGAWGGNAAGIGPNVGADLCFDTLGEALVCTFDLSGLSPEHQASFRLRNWEGANLGATDLWDWAVIDTSANTLTSFSSGLGTFSSQTAMAAATPAIGNGDVLVLAYKASSAATNKKLATLSFNILPVHVTPPVAQFTGTPVSGTAPLTVTFSNTSSGSITNVLWTFGDGQTSTASGATVTHTYASAGTYTVSLQVTGADGTDTQTRNAYITVTNPTTLLQNWTYDDAAGTLTKNAVNTGVPGDLVFSGTATVLGTNNVVNGDGLAIHTGVYVKKDTPLPTPTTNGTTYLRVDFAYWSLSSSDNNAVIADMGFLDSNGNSLVQRLTKSKVSQTPSDDVKISAIYTAGSTTTYNSADSGLGLINSAGLSVILGIDLDNQTYSLWTDNGRTGTYTKKVDNKAFNVPFANLAQFRYTLGGLNGDVKAIDAMMIGQNFTDISTYGITITPPPPEFSGINISGTNLILTGSGGVLNGSRTYLVYSATNLALPFSQWTVLSTNTFNAGGTFTNTLPVSSAEAQRFYRIELH